MVMQRFGDVKQLVEQTLDPMVSSYFKNVSQTRTFIELIQSRSELQAGASIDMRERFQAYSLEFQEVLIGTPKPQAGDTKIENIMSQLRDRQIAREQVETFAQKQIAADKQRELNEAEKRAAEAGRADRVAGRHLDQGQPRRGAGEGGRAPAPGDLAARAGRQVPPGERRRRPRLGDPVGRRRRGRRRSRPSRTRSKARAPTSS